MPATRRSPSASLQNSSRRRSLFVDTLLSDQRRSTRPSPSANVRRGQHTDITGKDERSHRSCHITPSHLRQQRSYTAAPTAYTRSNSRPSGHHGLGATVKPDEVPPNTRHHNPSIPLHYPKLSPQLRVLDDATTSDINEGSDTSDSPIEMSPPCEDDGPIQDHHDQGNLRNTSEQRQNVAQPRLRVRLASPTLSQDSPRLQSPMRPQSPSRSRTRSHRESTRSRPMSPTHHGCNTIEILRHESIHNAHSLADHVTSRTDALAKHFAEEVDDLQKQNAQNAEQLRHDLDATNAEQAESFKEHVSKVVEHVVDDRAELLAEFTKKEIGTLREMLREQGNRPDGLSAATTTGVEDVPPRPNNERKLQDDLKALVKEQEDASEAVATMKRTTITQIQSLSQKLQDEAEERKNMEDRVEGSTHRLERKLKREYAQLREDLFEAAFKSDGERVRGEGRLRQEADERLSRLESKRCASEADLQGDISRLASKQNASEAGLQDDISRLASKQNASEAKTRTSEAHLQDDILRLTSNQSASESRCQNAMAKVVEQQSSAESSLMSRTAAQVSAAELRLRNHLAGEAASLETNRDIAEMRLRTHISTEVQDLRLNFEKTTAREREEFRRWREAQIFRHVPEMRYGSPSMMSRLGKRRAEEIDNEEDAENLTQGDEIRAPQTSEHEGQNFHKETGENLQGEERTAEESAAAECPEERRPGFETLQDQQPQTSPADIEGDIPMQGCHSSYEAPDVETMPNSPDIDYQVAPGGMPLYHSSSKVPDSPHSTIFSAHTPILRSNLELKDRTIALLRQELELQGHQLHQAEAKADIAAGNNDVTLKLLRQSLEQLDLNQ